jgi:hypothetical protein
MNSDMKLSSCILKLGLPSVLMDVNVDLDTRVVCPYIPISETNYTPIRVVLA